MRGNSAALFGVSQLKRESRMNLLGQGSDVATLLEKLL